MKALIDADIVLHRVGYTTNEEEEWVARVRSDEMLDGILLDTSATNFECWLSDNRDSNFRYRISSSYKANRTAPRPRHYDIIKEHLIKQWGARIANEMEADDKLGIHQDKSGCNTVICSIDKDLLQIPGQHNNFVKKEWASVTEWEGIKWFYKQILIGDTSDNVQGCSGIGPVKAGKAIDPIYQKAGEESLFSTVLSLYRKQEKGLKEEEILERILIAGRLLKIKQQEEEELWNFPTSNRMLVLLASFIPTQQVANIPSTEPIIQATESGSQPLGLSKENTSPVEAQAST